MGVGKGLKKLGDRLGTKVGKVLDNVLGDQPDSASGAGDNHPKKPGSVSPIDLDRAASGFPRDLR